MGEMFFPRPAVGLVRTHERWVPREFPSGVKGLECEADHLPPSCAEVKNEWNYASIFLYAFMASNRCVF